MLWFSLSTFSWHENYNSLRNFPMIWNYIVDEFNEYSFPSEFDNDIKRKVKILKGQKAATAIFGAWREAMALKITFVKRKSDLIGLVSGSDLTLNIPETRWKYDHKTNKENIFHNTKAMKHTGLFFDEENSSIQKSQSMQRCRNSEKNGDSNRRNACNISRQGIAKTHWNDYLESAKTIYKDIPYPCTD